jgi:hypothetical protein
MAMTQREKNALDDHITREQPWETDGEGLPVIHITKTIASVTLGNGDMHPVEACYLAVARADEDGRFEFTIPHEDGASGHYVLTVEREYNDGGL